MTVEHRPSKKVVALRETMSHSPGPWAYQPSPLTGHDIMLKRKHWVFGSRETRQGLGLVFENEANALLVAAAPELLALAKKYASECSECDGTGEHFVGESTEGPQERCPDCADIRAVIDKAEGRR